jgi:hypothetical protein
LYQRSYAISPENISEAMAGVALRDFLMTSKNTLKSQDFFKTLQMIELTSYNRMHFTSIMNDCINCIMMYYMIVLLLIIKIPCTSTTIPLSK